MPQTRQTLALQLALALFETIFSQDDGRWVNDHHTGIAVDDHPVILTHQLAGTAGPHHSGNVHAACDDGRVRGLAPHIGDKTREHALLELQHVRRRKIMGHQHQRHIDGVVEQQLLLIAARRRGWWRDR